MNDPFKFADGYLDASGYYQIGACHYFNGKEIQRGIMLIIINRLKQEQ